MLIGPNKRQKCYLNYPIGHLRSILLLPYTSQALSLCRHILMVPEFSKIYITGNLLCLSIKILNTNTNHCTLDKVFNKIYEKLTVN